MRHSLLQLFQGHRKRATLLFIATISLVQNLASSWLEKMLGGNTNYILGAILGLGVLALILQMFLSKEKAENWIDEDDRPERYAGLIVIVSKPREDNPEKGASHEKAIDYHLNPSITGDPLKMCWLIASHGDKGTVLYAKETRKKYQGRCAMKICSINNVFDTAEVYRKVKAIYNEAKKDTDFPLDPKQIMADFTGGTTPMSVGLALACVQQKGTMQYTYGGGLRHAVSTPTSVDLRAKL